MIKNLKYTLIDTKKSVMESDGKNVWVEDTGLPPKRNR